MNPRIRRLLEAGMFKSPKLSKLGYGTFLDLEKTEVVASNCIEKAKGMKKEADSILPHSRDKGMKMYMETIFLYIKGYMEESNTCNEVDGIHRWKGLGKYVDSIMKLLKKDEEKLLDLFRLVLFNIKFYYLHLECSLMSKQYKTGKHKEGTQLPYFLKEYSSLHEIFESFGAESFSVIRPQDLEDFVRRKAEFMEKN